MPVVDAGGVTTYYELVGSGPPLLMFSPGGFSATIDNWSSLGTYSRLRLVEHLSVRFTCVLFDRRESGASGGRIERLTWARYAAQGKGLLDHLGADRAHLLGGCIGCSVVLAFAVAHPGAVSSMVLYSPAGGAGYRMSQQARFAQHLAYTGQHGLAGVVQLARSGSSTFSRDPRVGPWAPVIRADDGFAERYASHDLGRYRTLVAGMSRLMFDRDTVPGAEPEDLLLLDVPALVVPGHDDSHATSAARYLEECLPRSEYWDVAVEGQTEVTVPPVLLDFLGRAEEASPPARGAPPVQGRGSGRGAAGDARP